MGEESTFLHTLQSQCESVSLKFVLSSDHTPETCPSIMLAAFQLCDEQNYGPEWITEAEFLSLNDAGKKDVFVLDPFKGKAFEHGSKLCTSNAVRVIGPRCLTYCFMHKLPIPEYMHPMHDMAMHGVSVTCTGLSKTERERMKQLVQYMAGQYVCDLSSSVTHLIADTVHSVKYRVAQTKELPVMKPSWVEAVWKTMGGTCSPEETVIATDHKFLSHVCPVFMDHCVCVSQLPKRDKIAIKNLVEENGGKYSPQLEMEKSTLLVTTTLTSDKYKSAVLWKLPVVTPDYIYDSVQASYALDVSLYKLQRDSSTPTKDTKMLPPDVSLCSTIANSTLAVGHGVDPTMSFNDTLTAGHSTSITNAKIVAGIGALDGVCMSDVTCNGGLFLDGCKVYLSGWAEASAAQGGRAEKLRKLLNAGGASRFNQLTENVTHVIMGSFQGDTVARVRTWSSKPHLVSAEWLVESAKAGRLVEEEPYECVYHLPEAVDAHPKPCVPLAFNDTTMEMNDRDNNTANSTNRGIKRRFSNDNYGAVRAPEELSRRDSCASSMLGTEVPLAPIFDGLTFAVSGYDQEVLQELEDSLVKLGGRLMPALLSTKGVDYCVVPISGDGVFLPYAKHHVSHFFIEECTTAECVLKLQYHHLPLMLPSAVVAARPLDGVVLTVSAYVGRERQFLAELARQLGARVQEMFSRKDNAKKEALGATHLVCSEASGQKYDASVKWKIPAVTRDWLLMCAKEGVRVSEQSHLTTNPTPHSVDALKIMLQFIAEYMESKTPPRCLPSGDRFNDSSMIAPTPYTPNRVVTLRAESTSKADLLSSNRVLHTTPGMPTTPSAITTPDMDTLRKLYPTPGGRSVKNGDSVDAMPTPETPYGICYESNPSKRTRKLFKKTLDCLPVGKSEKMRQLKEKYGKKMLELVKNSMTEEERSQAINREKEERVPEKAAPLSGCVVFVHKKLRDQLSDTESKVQELGGRFEASFGCSVTHYVYQGKVGDASNRDLKQARDAGCLIVAPDWVNACCEQKQWLEESLYPYTHNCNMSLNVIQEKLSPEKKSLQNESSLTEDLSQINDGDATQVYEEQNRTNNATVSKDLAKDLEELERLAADRETQTQSYDGHETECGPAKSNSFSRRRSSGFMRKSSRADDDHEQATTLSNVGTMELPTGSQCTNIAWADPSDSAARRLLSASATADQTAISLADDQSETHDVCQAPDEDQKGTLRKRRYKFLLSNMEAETSRLEQEVMMLGGEVDADVYSDVTHVITKKPSRSERLLAAIAAGKWVLHSSYIKASLEKNGFVDEEEYEWGNPKSAATLPRLQPGTIEESLVRAAHRLRKMVESGLVGGAFSGWKVLVISKPSRVTVLSRLLAAGDAVVISEADIVDLSVQRRACPCHGVVPAWCPDNAKRISLLTLAPQRRLSESNFPSGLTHCFVELQHAPNFDVSLFAKRRVPCLEPLFIHQSLWLNSCLHEHLKHEKAGPSDSAAACWETSTQCSSGHVKCNTNLPECIAEDASTLPVEDFSNGSKNHG
ncbi:BRCT domain [Trinorchestia longiramus]|nr:BRCT domain [Trinorchestia longiramus]